MNNWQLLKQQLTDFIAHYQLQRQASLAQGIEERGIEVFEVEMSSAMPLLSWLKAQQQYPQFYFKLRDQDTSLVALGKVRSFFDKFCAEQFMLAQKLPLVGGLKFNGESLFYLPQLLLRQEEHNIRCSLFLDRQQRLDGEQLAQLIACFDQFQPLEPNNTHEFSEQPPQASFAQWQQWINQALARFQQGELAKVVLANQYPFVADSPINAKDVLWQSEQVNQHCYHFLWSEAPEEAFIGSSPERLFQRQQQQLQTEALAGTALLGTDPNRNQKQAAWLWQDSKNQQENWLVVEGICHNLRPYSQQVEVQPLELLRLRNVQHLRRPIQARLQDSYGDAHCLNAIHPTAAVSGLPKQTAIDFIKNCENFDRSWYAGTLGFMQPEQAEFCVTIRSAMISQNKIHIFAGAGIVAGSDPLLEWQEIAGKALGLISLFKQVE